MFMDHFTELERKRPDLFQAKQLQKKEILEQQPPLRMDVEEAMFVDVPMGEQKVAPAQPAALRPAMTSVPVPSPVVKSSSDMNLNDLFDRVIDNLRIAAEFHCRSSLGVGFLIQPKMCALLTVTFCQEFFDDAIARRPPVYVFVGWRI